MSEKFTVKKIKKHTIILFKGEDCKAVYKVLTGCLKSYIIDEKGNQHIVEFAAENEIISDLNSFVNGVPSLIFIESVEDSKILVISRLFLKNIEFLNKQDLLYALFLIAETLINANNRISKLISLGSSERYADFVKTYPHLVQRLSQKSIASFINVTPEYLSDIKNKANLS
ncbi:Crp/Fnr family transcriptional regulator [uncultured Flavobacterium sp.]|jgi:CRP-like cAMP-binding protein|uniref:Crp/Fnr family transcriptional regulator n=1 Tax=uncultured Flavobacterium sp. TaxID=165435 RepID=UPI003081F904